MTEIPEHLLKRSRERRAALGLGGDDAESSAPAAPAAPAASDSSGTAVEAAPTAAPARAAAAAPPAPPPPKPDPPYVAAARNRQKIPFWAMAALSLMPLWGFLYIRSITEQVEVVSGPLGTGATEYSTCQSCHGAAGGGGVGRAFTGGEVLLTFPHIEDQLNFVDVGTEGFENAGLTTYGDPNRPGGAHAPRSFNGGAMPAQAGTLTEAEILGVVCHERYTLGGADPTSAEWLEEYEEWCSPESEIFAGLEDGSLTFENLADDVEGVLPVGNEARAGTPAGGE